METEDKAIADIANDLKVPIKSSMRDAKAFSPRLESNLVTATVLSYLDFSDEVLEFLQKFTNSSRAYCVNHKGIKGFLVNIIIP